MIRAINYYTEYPKAALETKIDGKVILRFYIDVDGSIGDIKVLSSSPDILNQSAIQCLKKMPKWNPGKEDGEPIKVYYWLPFVFKSDQYYQTPKE